MHPTSRFPRLLTLALALVLLLVGGVLGTTIYSTARDMVVSAQFVLPSPPAVPVVQRSEPQTTGSGTGAGQEPQSPLAAAIASPGSDRVNILILGLDVPDGTTEPARTDSIILISLDPSGGPVNMLSIPRDLWVPIGPYGENRINTAYFIGETRDYPGGGAGLLRATIEQDFGIPIDYYATVDFATFKEAVNYVGGVTVDVEQEIYDSDYPDGNGDVTTVHIAAGMTHMDGETALQYARSRHGNSDFDRARRQQRLLIALRDEYMKGESVASLIPKLPSMYRTFADRVETDLSLDELVSLAKIAGGLDLSDVEMTVIDTTMTTRYITAEGWDVLLPIPEKIAAVVDRFLRAHTGSPPPDSDYDLEASPQITAENARILLANGSGRAGLAVAVTEYLRALGFQVEEATDMERQDYSTSVMIIYAERPATVAALASALGLTSGNLRSSIGSPGTEGVDIKVILGQDFTLSLN